ncbi:uncharacterized protein LOC115665990 isoform X1 [Syzygium oleosum]|uniref:uncharacterized protein LOC115665990 isoform X1 n=2 Tax=Syzygium oleosum TaxID=219896 RepID=UPI0024B8ED10|nr:uncharacterized protein LOC115665990 isoform X1 [Syzygium oleosum]
MSSSSPSRRAEVPVFTVTGIGTRIAVSVAPTITASDLKRVLERAHFSCFPEIGEIRVDGVMVERRSCLYYLPNSMPVKYAFQGIEGSWFIHLDITCLECLSQPCSHHCIAIGNHVSDVCDTDPSKSQSLLLPHNIQRMDKYGAKGSHYGKPLLPQLQRDIRGPKKKKRNKHRWEGSSKEDRTNVIDMNWHFRTEENPFTGVQSSPKGTSEVVQLNERKSSTHNEHSNTTSSEVISVGGIINRYFTNFSEVNSFGSPSNPDFQSRALRLQLKSKLNYNCPSIQVDASAEFAVETPPRLLTTLSSTKPSPGSLSNAVIRSRVGKSLIMASRNLGTPATPRGSVVSLCRSRNRKQTSPNTLPIKFSVFEISEDDE